jgi:Arc/MetJ-type ribon-helix-helix transcriptional regulator
VLHNRNLHTRAVQVEHREAERVQKSRSDENWNRSSDPDRRVASPQPSNRALLDCGSLSMINYHTAMPKTKVALTLDTELLERVDELVAKRRFRNRSQAVETALADKVQRLARTRLARESAKLNPKEEKRLANEGLVDALDSWPEY